jgi:hypothetical protein
MQEQAAAICVNSSRPMKMGKRFRGTRGIILRGFRVVKINPFRDRRDARQSLVAVSIRTHLPVALPASYCR